MNISPRNDILMTYKGDGPSLFRLTFVTGILTILTLGIYRFWAKTRIRKFIWAGASADGDSFEYTGTGLEKLLGFLVAVVFLAVYLGIIQMILLFFGLSVMMDPDDLSPQAIFGQVAAIYISFLAVLPFLFYAMYRSRRYMMARTRWRGLRFGMDKGAWGYAFRTIGHGLLTIVTLGALLPRQTFFLEKYMTDRSYFGTARFTQNGKWTGLYKGMKHVGIGLALILVGAALGYAVTPGLSFLSFIGYIWLLIGFVHYSVFSFGYLNSHKSLEGGATLVSAPRTGSVLKIYVVGTLVLAVLGIVIAIATTVLSASFFNVRGLVEPGLGTVILGAVIYIVVLVLMQALAMVLITQPILKHYIETMRIDNAPALMAIQQREAATGLDAGGFADALDVGGAI